MTSNFNNAKVIYRATGQKAGMAHAGRLYHGDDGKLYVIYLDWSASELVS